MPKLRLPPGRSDGEIGPSSGFRGHLEVTGEGQLTYSCAYVTNVGAGKNRVIGCSAARVVLDAVDP